MWSIRDWTSFLKTCFISGHQCKFWLASMVATQALIPSFVPCDSTAMHNLGSLARLVIYICLLRFLKTTSSGIGVLCWVSSMINASDRYFIAFFKLRGPRWCGLGSQLVGQLPKFLFVCFQFQCFSLSRDKRILPLPKGVLEWWLCA